MGVTYFFEFVGFILSWLYGTEKVWKYLVFNNIVNALQGVLIFVVLICKRPIWKMLNLTHQRLIPHFSEIKSCIFVDLWFKIQQFGVK